MATQELTTATFRGEVEKDGILIVDWWASWCGPCKAFAPVYEEVAAKNPDIAFGKVNTESEPALATEFDIRAIPTLMVFRERVLLFSQAGALPKEALEDLVRQVKALDMEKVRSEIAKQHQEQHQAKA
ncbi:MAG TPA: thioredoxin family protein [Myxococcaceae bacterium]|nr:thioredoxin family protein [Myxococcaceae bacterium]